MTYKVKYNLDPEVGEFTAEECCERENGGGCDAFIFISMLFPDSGAYSQLTLSFDGRNEGKPVSQEDLFKAWALIAYELAQSDAFRDAAPGRHKLVSDVHALIKDAVLSARDDGDGA